MTPTVSDLVVGRPQVRSALATLAELHQQTHPSSQLAVLPTGFDPLDEVLAGGIRQGEVVLLGGKPGVGKTIAALQWARSMAQRGVVAVYLCFEHDEVTLLTRLLSCELGEMLAAASPESSGLRHYELQARIRDVAAGAITLREALDSDALLDEAQRRVAAYADRLVLVTGSGSAHRRRRHRRRHAALRGPAGRPVRRLRAEDAASTPPSPARASGSGASSRASSNWRSTSSSSSSPSPRPTRRASTPAGCTCATSGDRPRSPTRRTSIVVLNDKLAVVSRAHVAHSPQRAEEFHRQVVFSVEKNRNGSPGRQPRVREGLHPLPLPPAWPLGGRAPVDRRVDRAVSAAVEPPLLHHHPEYPPCDPTASPTSSGLPSIAAAVGAVGRAGHEPRPVRRDHAAGGPSADVGTGRPAGASPSIAAADDRSRRRRRAPPTHRAVPTPPTADRAGAAPTPTTTCRTRADEPGTPAGPSPTHRPRADDADDERRRRADGDTTRRPTAPSEPTPTAPVVTTPTTTTTSSTHDAFAALPDGMVRPISFPVLGPVRYGNDWGNCRDGCSRRHVGTDMIGVRMQPLLAAVDGTVTRVRYENQRHGRERRSPSPAPTGGGTTTSTSTTTRRAPTTASPAPSGRSRRRSTLGSTVRAGQVIAYMGDSGNAEGSVPHVHFEIRQPDGTPINPYHSLAAAQERQTCEPDEARISLTADATTASADAVDGHRHRRCRPLADRRRRQPRRRGFGRVRPAGAMAWTVWPSSSRDSTGRAGRRRAGDRRRRARRRRRHPSPRRTCRGRWSAGSPSGASRRPRTASPTPRRPCPRSTRCSTTTATSSPIPAC